ncbi:hypothetical protein CEXT_787531 [Caerostris extrusa]|uniref:Uncharacterized protein n=1 Tax=Caerostris extrusa TaxID=172846 RepID=A0AAV4RYU1_CAEEX|nr:hypothetical protein CEXT_787531 [Caerostris extrusa]
MTAGSFRFPAGGLVRLPIDVVTVNYWLGTPPLSADDIRDSIPNEGPFTIPDNLFQNCHSAVQVLSTFAGGCLCESR